MKTFSGLDERVKLETCMPKHGAAGRAGLIFARKRREAGLVVRDGIFNADDSRMPPVFVSAIRKLIN